MASLAERRIESGAVIARALADCPPLGRLHAQVRYPVQLADTVPTTTSTTHHNHHHHTPSTTTRIAQECQDSSVAPIVGSLRRSLWPHDVVVCVRSHRPGECTTTPDPSGEYGEARGSRPQGDTGFFSPEACHPVCRPSRRRAVPRADHSSQRTTTRRGSQRRSAPAVQNNNDEVHGRTDRQAMMG